MAEFLPLFTLVQNISAVYVKLEKDIYFLEERHRITIAF